MGVMVKPFGITVSNYCALSVGHVYRLSPTLIYGVIRWSMLEVILVRVSKLIRV